LEVLVTGCVPGGFAEKLGLCSGDVIVRYGGSEVTSTDRLIELTQQGREANRALVVRRDGKQLYFTVPPGKLGVEIVDRPALPRRRNQQVRPEAIGFRRQD